MITTTAATVNCLLSGVGEAELHLARCDVADFLHARALSHWQQAVNSLTRYGHGLSLNVWASASRYGLGLNVRSRAHGTTLASTYGPRPPSMTLASTYYWPQRTATASRYNLGLKLRPRPQCVPRPKCCGHQLFFSFLPLIFYVIYLLTYLICTAVKLLHLRSIFLLQ